MIASFLDGWRLWTGRPDFDGDESRFRRGLALVPAAGAAIGLVAALLAVFLIRAVGMRMTVAGILAGVLIPIGVWWILRGRPVFGMLRLVESWAEANAVEGGLLGSTRYASAWAALAVENLFLVKVVCTAVIVAGGAALWVGIAPVLGSAVYATLVQQSLADDSEKSLTTRGGPWIVAAVMTVLLAGIMRMLIPGILAILVCVLITRPLSRWVGNQCGGLDESGVRTTAELIEAVVLLLGVFAASTPVA